MKLSSIKQASENVKLMYRNLMTNYFPKILSGKGIKLPGQGPLLSILESGGFQNSPHRA